MTEPDPSTVFDSGIVAILRGVPTDDVCRVVEAILDGGVTAVEITANTDGFLDQLSAVAPIVADRGGALGAGTVLDPETAVAALDAGASFVVTPTLNEAVVETCNRYGVVSIPGVLTPTEALSAVEAGADACKIFPASSVGPAHVSSVRGPLPQLPLVPTGGIGPENAAAYFEAGAVALGVGSSIAPDEAVRTGDLESITDNARTLVDVATDYRA
jgi:2-dehydro-3-deoxyphosphogluconate aldolase/(4S)-4-hydroxy-2-oxoglutarate aldolase